MRDLRNRLARLPAIDGENGDNLLIALATYFEGSLDCPEEDEPGGDTDDCGWKSWAIEKAEDLMARIVAEAQADAGRAA